MQKLSRILPVLVALSFGVATIGCDAKDEKKADKKADDKKVDAKGDAKTDDKADDAKADGGW